MPVVGHPVPSGIALNVFEKEMSVLDIVYVLVAVAVFAVIGLVARGVEKL